ncbi:MAG: nodulation protein NfeD [Acidobacteria bacterium]|nr:nodulation protein NfeD [Acidobacteriota bacterium]
MRTAIAAVSSLLAAFLVATPAGAGMVVHMHLDDTIQPASQRYVERGLREAAARGASLVVLQLDTPGGLMSSMRKITTAITSSKVPVVVYVAPPGAQAASAGFFILMAADVAAMAPGTNAGASHPVGGQGENLPTDVRKKATNDAAAMLRALTKPRGRDPALAAKAVTESLSFTADEALKDGLIDMVVPDLATLISRLDGTEVERFDGTKQKLDLAGATVEEVPPTGAEKFLSVLANPNVAYLLMALGGLGIYLELSHPGAVLPGVVGVIAILLFLYSMSVLPVNLAGAALIVVGLVLFILEVKVTSYGLLTVGGLVSFVLGSMMLFNAPIPAMRVSLGVIIPTALVVAAVMIFLLSRVLAVHRRRPVTGSEGLVGEIGEARTEIDGKGRVLVHGEYWDAESRSGRIEAGTPVRVLLIRGRTLEVEAVSSEMTGRST